MEAIATKTPEAMSESFAQPDMQERFSAWAERTIKEARQEEKKEKTGPREISLKGRSDEEREWIEKVGQKDESAKESRRESSAEKEPAADGEQRPKATESAKPDGEKPASESAKPGPEPIAADLAERHWQGKLQGEEVQNHIRQVDGRIGLVMDFIGSHPQKTQMEQGFRALCAGKPPAATSAFFRDLAICIAEAPDPASVFRHITLQPEDREVLRKAKNWQELRAGIRTIAKLYPATASRASQPSPKPRAPKPPSEVGGRGASTEDAAVAAAKDGNFSSFSESMNHRHGRR